MGTKHAAVGLGFLVVGAVAPGCSSSSAPATPANGSGGTFAVYGTVRTDAGEGAKPLAGIEVTIAGDFDGDGVRAASETVKTTTDAAGFYAAQVTVTKATRLGIGWRGEGRLPNHKSFRVSGASPIMADAVLAQGEPFVVAGSRLELPGGSLAVEGLPAGASGLGRLYNPAFEAEFFPGEFRDDKGTPIVSAAFATLEMKDANGAPLEKLAAPATLTMAVPRDTWSVLRDMTPGNGRIDVPKYWYDEAQGTWVQEGLGKLVDSAGRTLAEGDLAALHDRTFGEEISAVYEVTHFSTYNVDFPRSTGTVSARGKGGGDKGFLDRVTGWFNDNFNLTGGSDEGQAPPKNPPKPPKRDPKRDLQQFDAPRSNSIRSFTNPNLGPMSGAILHADYFYADGTPAGRATFEADEDGNFEIEAPRSEAPGEDLDDNGVTGETFYLSVTAEWFGLRFHVVEGKVPTGSERVIAMGELDLSATLVEPARCEVTGVVRYANGAAAVGADVWMVPDRYASEEVSTSLCGSNGALCTDTTVTGADGRFTVSVPFEQTFTIDASRSLVEPPWEGDYFTRKTYAACPAQPIVVTLRAGYLYATPVFTVNNGTITWSGGFLLDRLVVEAPDGQRKWELLAQGAGFPSPVVFGTKPAGVSEPTAPSGTLASGDLVTLYGTARDPRGYEGRILETYEVP
jgi:hypothetical protein